MASRKAVHRATQVSVATQESQALVGKVSQGFRVHGDGVGIVTGKQIGRAHV